MSKDPICGMDLEPKDAVAQAVYQGQTYYFCHESCKQKFESDPRKYTGVQTPKPK